MRLIIVIPPGQGWSSAHPVGQLGVLAHERRPAREAGASGHRARGARKPPQGAIEAGDGGRQLLRSQRGLARPGRRAARGARGQLGEPAWPDPARDGNFTSAIDTSAIDLSSARYLSADRACGHLLPNGGMLTDAQVRQALSVLSAYAACMRAHGIPAYPAPDPRNAEAGATGARTGRYIAMAS
jgi:hypothetical protein